MSRSPKQTAAGGKQVSMERAISRLEDEARLWESKAARLRASVAAMRGEVKDAGKGAPSGKPGRPARGAAMKAASTKKKGRPAKSHARASGAGALATEILIEWDRPARAAELLPEIQRRGILLGGNNPMATLASTLIKYPGVTRVGRGLYAAAPGGVPVRRKPGRKPRRGGTAPGRKAGKKAASASRG